MKLPVQIHIMCASLARCFFWGNLLLRPYSRRPCKQPSQLRNFPLNGSRSYRQEHEAGECDWAMRWIEEQRNCQHQEEDRSKFEMQYGFMWYMDRLLILRWVVTGDMPRVPKMHFTLGTRYLSWKCEALYGLVMSKKWCFILCVWLICEIISVRDVIWGANDFWDC